MSERRCIPALSHQYSQWVHRSPRSRVTRNSRQAYIIPCHGYGLFISTDLISNLPKKQAATLTVACVRIAAGPNCEWNQWRSKALGGHGSTVTWGPSVASVPRVEAGSPKCWARGWGFGYGLVPGLGSDVSSPSGVSQQPKVLGLFVFSDDLSWYWKVCHFTDFCHACKSDRSVNLVYGTVLNSKCQK